MSTKNKTLEHCAKRRRVKQYPIWGVGDVWIQNVTERERQVIEGHMIRNGKLNHGARQENLAWWIRGTVVTDERATQFEYEDSDVRTLADMDCKVADSYRKAINKHCGVEEADAKKNSETGQDA